MTCEDNTCGIGGWGGPLPGDPSNDISLRANTVYGGINVTWTYPTVNPHAVAHTLLYRGVNDVFESSQQRGVVAGSAFFDQIDLATPITYFYWIRIVSVNGTISDLVGPASTTSVPRVQQTLESLTGRIDDGVLAQSLKTSISGVTTVAQNLATETAARLAGNVGFAAALALANQGVGQAVTYVQNEITQRQTGDQALVTSLSLLGSAVGANYAAFLDEKTVRTSKDAAYASQFTTLFTSVGNNLASFTTFKEAQTTLNAASAHDITTLYAGLSTTNNNLLTTAAAVVDERNARVTADGAIATRISSTEVSFNGNLATVQTNLSATISTVNGHVQQIGALYTAKVEVNGLIGGFGVYNDGSSVQAGFDVDVFWIGRTNQDKVKPFIIDSGIVYIDKARIRNADIDTLKIAGNSVMTGYYDQNFGANVPANGASVLISRTIDLGDSFNSGLILTGTVSCNAPTDVTVGFQFTVNGTVVGDCRASLKSGYADIFPVSAFGTPGSRYATVQLIAYNPSSSAGSNKPFIVGGATMGIMGGKR